MKLVIERAAAQKILDYLATKTYSEVHQIIPLILNLPKIAGTETEEELKEIEALAKAAEEKAQAEASKVESEAKTVETEIASKV